jgi:hypothetical protein
MHRLAARSLMLVMVFLIVGSLSHLNLAAQESTPAASPKAGSTTAPPAVGTPVASTAAACDPAAFPAGTTGVTYEPLLDYGFVIPADNPDHNLYLTVNTLPPQTCFLFDRGTHGASTYLVLEGTVEFIAWRAWDPAEPIMMAGNADGVSVPLPSGAPVTLNAGDWVTVDRDLEAYAYRNPGPSEGKIVMAIFEKLGPRDGCASGCRRHP